MKAAEEAASPVAGVPVAAGAAVGVAVGVGVSVGVGLGVGVVSSSAPPFSMIVNTFEISPSSKVTLRVCLPAESESR